MDDRSVDGFLERFAPADVRETIAWLTANGYPLSSHDGDNTFGAQFVYSGDARVLVTVDRSQWMLDVAARPGAEALQYDLLIAAQAGQPYRAVFPKVPARSAEDALPLRLPEGVSWRETLPKILQWVNGDEVPTAVDRARNERSSLT